MFLGSLFPLLTTIGPRNRNHQWSIHWKASCSSGAWRSSLPLPHIPAPQLGSQSGPPFQPKSPLLSLFPQTGIWSRVQGKATVWHEGSLGLLGENFLPRMKSSS